MQSAALSDPAQTRAGQPRIAVRGLRKRYPRAVGGPVTAIDDVTLDVAEGEFLVLLGPSGCGKTTLLRALAGLEPVQGGRIELDGVLVDEPAAGVRMPTERRRLSMMFQSYALWPHKTVYQNVEYPLAARRISRPERGERVRRILDAVGIGALADRHPGQLSGGQQQRVALARALVAGDGIVLFDEPLSNVDAKVRELLRAEIQRLHRELGFTAVYVTHDQDEALTLGTRVLVLRDGRIAQSGTPREIYDAPADGYVMRFMGATNEIPGALTGTGGMATTALGPVRGRAAAGAGAGDAVIAFSRPERWRCGPVAPSGTVNDWPAEVTGAVYLGFCTDLTLRVADAASVRVRTVGSTGPEVGALTRVWVEASDVLFLPETGSTV